MKMKVKLPDEEAEVLGQIKKKRRGWAMHPIISGCSYLSQMVF